MNKKIIAILICLVLFVLGIGLVIFLNYRSEVLVKEASYPGSVQKKLSGDRVILATPSGEVSIKNIFETKNTTYTPAGEPIKTVISESDEFSFDYYYEGDHFTVYLLKQPVAESRKKAEADILSSLDISKDDACKLSFSLHIPISVDKTLGTDDKFSYGLSWCPEDYTL